MDKLLKFHEYTDKLLKVNGDGFIEFFGVVIGSLATIVFGTWLPLMTTLLVLNVADIVSGVLKGGKEHAIGSRKFYTGIQKKAGQWLLIIVGNSLDTMVFDGMPISKTLLVSFLVATEGISITENLAIIGVPIPAFLKERLVQVQESNSRLEDLNKAKEKFNNEISK